MDTTDSNKFFRWSISGWIAILSAIVFIILDIISTIDGERKIFDSIYEFVNILGSDSITNFFFIALAGFPLGFIIYQFYFFIRWNSPFSENGLWPPFTLGRKDETLRVIKDIKKHDLNYSGTKWRKKWIYSKAYKTDQSYKWQYIESLLTEAFQKLDSKYIGANLYERYRYLVEMSHTLGAALGGVYVGFLAYWIIKMRVEKLPLTSYAIFLTVVTAILLFFLAREDSFQQKRRDSNNKLNELEKDSVISFKLFKSKININQPSILFIITFGMIIFFASNALRANQGLLLSPHYFWRVILLGPVLFALFEWSGSPEEKRGAGISLSFGLIISLLVRHLRDVWLTTIDWPFFSALFIFLALNLVLIKNRQNAMDDLVALENYTLKRFLKDEDCCRKG